jgi:parallel beta-helix repeat protein
LYEFQEPNLQTLAIINIGPGNITGNNTWTSLNTYIIDGNVSVIGNLTILAGTLIIINGNFTVSVNGSLVILGSKSNEVVITPAIPDPGYWGGIWVNSNVTGSIKFAKLSYAINGIYFNNTRNFSVKSTNFKYCSESGITCFQTYNISIVNNSFSDNKYVSLSLESAENSTVEYNSVNINPYGIILNNSINNSLMNNSLSNRISNAFDNGQNIWKFNYYGNYSGIDTNGDNIGDTLLPYTIGGGANNDSYPRTKIFFNDTLFGFATLSAAIAKSTANTHIFLRPETPGAGSQTIIQEGYYYENILINSSIGHAVHIHGPTQEGYKNITLDGNMGTCLEVNGSYKLEMVGICIINSETGIHIRNSTSRSVLYNLKLQNNLNGIILEDSKNIRIENLTVKDNNMAGDVGGLLVSNCQNITIYNNSLTNNYNGIFLSNSNLNYINKNNCTTNQDTGIRLNHSSFNIITNNTMLANNIAGANLSFGSNDNIFFNNSFQINENGIELYNSNNNYFNRNFIFANPEIGIYFENGSNNNTFLGLTSGTFSGSDKAIESNRSVNNLFINSTITNMKIWLDQNSKMTFLNSIFSDQYVLVWDILSSLEILNYLTVKVVNYSNIPISGALVEIYDNKSTLIFNNYTDSNGTIPLIICMSYIQYKNGKDYSSNSHRVTVNDSVSEKLILVNVTSKSIRIIKFNYYPIFTTSDNITAKEKTYYSFQYNALNNENDKTLYWSFSTNASDWLSFGETNHTLTGTPHNRDVGNPWVNISIADTDGDRVSRNFTLIIENTPPEILTNNILSLYEDEYYFNDYNSTDDDGYYNDTGVLIVPEQNLTSWSIITTAGSWLKFDNETGILNGTPDNTDVGTYSVHIFVYDGHGEMINTNFDLEVINVPPEIITNDITSTFKNEEYYNDYNSTDDGQGVITWKLRTDADWLYFDKQEGIINGTPLQDDVGEWWVNITVIDEHGGRSSTNFTLKVIDLNEPPTIITEAQLVAFTDVEYYVKYEAIDIDTPQDLLIWQLSEDLAESNATWLTMDPKTGVLRGTPLRRHVGWYWVTVNVLDNAGGLDSSTFRIDVILSPNQPPEMLTILNVVTFKSNEKWTKQFKAIDDYTSTQDLVWSVRSDSPWVIINSTSGIIDLKFNQSFVGTYWVNVTVTDEIGLINSTNFTLIITSSNKAPKLSNSGMHPKTGDTDTVFSFWVIYADRDNDSGIVKIIIDDETFLMKPDPKNRSMYIKGVNYTKEIKLSPGAHSYYFIAEDKWGLEAKYDIDVPSQNFPAETNDVEEIIITPYYMESTFWIIIIIITIIILSILLMVIKPEYFNPVVRARQRRELEDKGEFGYLCPICKKVLAEDAESCDKCGESFIVEEYLCPNCQAVVDSRATFCSSCGSRFEELEIEEEEFEEEDLEEELAEVEPAMVEDEYETEDVLEEMDEEPEFDEEFEPEEIPELEEEEGEEIEPEEGGPKIEVEMKTKKIAAARVVGEDVERKEPIKKLKKKKKKKKIKKVKTEEKAETSKNKVVRTEDEQIVEQKIEKEEVESLGEVEKVEKSELAEDVEVEKPSRREVRMAMPVKPSDKEKKPPLAKKHKETK